MHALSEDFDANELRRARVSLEAIDLRASRSRVRTRLITKCVYYCLLRTSERVTHLHIPVPSITRGTLARTHELKMIYPRDI